MGKLEGQTVKNEITTVLLQVLKFVAIGLLGLALVSSVPDNIYQHR